MRKRIQDNGVQADRVVQSAIVRATHIYVGPSPLVIEPGGHLSPALVSNLAESILPDFAGRIADPQVQKMA